MQMLCEIPKGSDFFFLWHKRLIFMAYKGLLNFYGISTLHGKNAEAFKLLGIGPELIFEPSPRP